MVGLINKEDIYDIADAIREKTQTEDTFKPSEMGDLIRSIRVIPENSYQLKEIESTPTSLATFDADALPMPSLKVGIEPIQEGSGDPSPTNVRPISGWDEANVTVADDVENPTVSNVYTIDLDGTRYGGTLDVVSGVLTVTHGEVDLGDLNWMYDPTSWIGANFYAELNNIKYIGDYATTTYPILCEKYKVAARNLDSFVDDSITVDGSVGQPTHIQVKDSTYTDAIAFKTAVTGTKLVYELATAQTIQLTPTQVKSLLGTNNIWADTGNILEGEYFKAL